MAAVDLLGALRSGSQLVSHRDDDMYDRLSNRWSIGLILMLAVLLSANSYIGDPIDCIEPQEFEDHWVEYMDNICWVSNTYYVPKNESIPDPNDPYEQELQYYQWVPIALAVQALLFMIPATFWNTAAKNAGYNIKDIVELCRSTDKLNPKTRDETTAYLASNMIRYMNYRQPYKRMKAPMGKRYGKYVCIMYLLSKVLYIANAIIQLFLLNFFIGDGYHTFGYDSLKNLLNGDSWESSPLFPRNTLCSFEIRRMGSNIHRYTVQCLLSVNLFNEKAYMIIWWWLLFVAIMSTLGLVLWLLTAITPTQQRTYIKKYLKIMGRQANDSEVADFTDNLLRMDGVFTLRQIAKNTNDAIVGEVIGHLWDKYMEGRKTHAFDETDSLA